MAKRWAQRPDGSTWGDWGDDDELGRINLLTPQKVLEGAREVQAGISFSLSLPLDFPGGSSLNQRRYPPITRPTEDLRYQQDTFFNVVARDSLDPSYTDVWSDDVVTLWLQYSTQWDALVHQGALFDADLDGVAEPVYYNGFRAGQDVIGPQPDAKGDGSGSVSFARHLGLEHMAAHGVQGRGVLIDLAHHLGNTPEWTRVGMGTIREIMAADHVRGRARGHGAAAHRVRDPGAGLGQEPGRRRRSSGCIPTSTARTPRCSSGSRESQLSALIADNYAVEGWPRRSAEPHTLLPVHHLCLFKLGVPLGELWYLHDLAAWLREHRRSRFLLTAPPLRLPGVAGSPLTPVATV